MYLSIVSKNGERITKKNQDSIFNSKDQQKRFWDWVGEVIPYSEVKTRVEKLGYEVWEGDDEFDIEHPQEVTRFQIWHRVDIHTRKPEVVEFEGMKLGIKVS